MAQLNEQFRRMQRLAGIITEEQLNEQDEGPSDDALEKAGIDLDNDNVKLKITNYAGTGAEGKSSMEGPMSAEKASSRMGILSKGGDRKYKFDNLKEKDAVLFMEVPEALVDIYVYPSS